MDGAINEVESTDEVEFPKASAVSAMASVTTANTPLTGATSMTQGIGLKLDRFADRLLEFSLPSCWPPWLSLDPRLRGEGQDYRDII